MSSPCLCYVIYHCPCDRLLSTESSIFVLHCNPPWECYPSFIVTCFGWWNVNVTKLNWTTCSFIWTYLDTIVTLCCWMSKLRLICRMANRPSPFIPWANNQSIQRDKGTVYDTSEGKFKCESIRNLPICLSTLLIDLGGGGNDLASHRNIKNRK